MNKDKARSTRFGLCFLLIDLPQRFTHCRAGVRFGHGIEVAIDIRRGAHIAMSKPFLDLLHWYALGEEHRGAGVAKIVEADLLQIVLFQKLSEVSGDEVGIVELAERVHADIVGVFLGICRAHHLFHLLLLLAVTDQLTSYEWLQRQRAVGGFCFQSVLGDDFFLGGVNGVADGQRVFREVDCRPLQPDWSSIENLNKI